MVKELETSMAAGVKPADAPVTPPPAAVEPPVVVDPPVAVELPLPTPVPDEETGPPKRLRVEALPEADRYKIAAAVHLAKAEGLDFDTAYARLAAPKAAPAEATPNPLTTLQAEANEIESRLDAAAADNSLFTPELRKDLKRQQEIERLIIKEESKRQQEQTAQVQTEQEKFTTGWDASEARAEALYDPEHTKAGSPLVKAVSTEIEAIAKNPNHPLYGNEELPELMFAKHAARLGIAPKAAVKATPAAPTGRILPVGGGLTRAPATEAEQRPSIQARMAEAFRSGDTDLQAALAEEELTGKPASRNRNALSIR